MSETPRKIRLVGLVGLGIMGAPMARNLLKAGFDVIVHNRTRDREKPLADAGAKRAGSPAEVAAGSDVSITIVSDTPDVEAVVLGAGGILEGAEAGHVTVDMSTISPAATRRIAEQAAARGVETLDAPVSGGDVGARDGTLSIMVGGKEDVFYRVLPVFEAMGKTITYIGDHGAGQTTKLCNQVAVTGTLLATCEALILAERCGLNAERVRAAISGGAAGSWQMTNLGPRMLARDFAPGFLIRLLLKDLRLVKEAADELNLTLPGCAQVQQLYQAAQSAGDGEAGTQALFKVIEKLSPP